jgi:hypothetical protein
VEREDKKEALKEKDTMFIAKSTKVHPCQKPTNGHVGKP